MTLKQYLKATGETPTAFGRRVGVVHTTVLRWCDGTMEPSPELLPEVVRATNGQCSAAEIAPRAAKAAARAAKLFSAMAVA